MIGNTAEQVLASGGDPVSSEVLDQQNQKIHWKQCASCRNIKDPKRFRSDSSYRDGRAAQCLDCESRPKLPIEEHVIKLYEENYYNERTKDQRFAHTLDYLDDEARLSGKWMNYQDLIWNFRKNIPNLFIRDGNLENHIACYRIWGRPQPHLEGKTFRYACGFPMKRMPEYSTYVVDDLDIIHKQKQVGWRTPLLKLILQGLITEVKADRVFGEARGSASTVYRRTLYEWRNRTK
jgi:hypothetical protein